MSFNILQILPELESGGVEIETLEVAKKIEEQGFNSYIISNGGELLDEIKHRQIIHIKLSVHSKNPIIILKNIISLCRIINRYNIHLIHARSRIPAWIAYLAIKLNSNKINRNKKCCFVTTVHGAYSNQNYIKHFYNKIMTKGDKVIAISDFIKSYIVGYYPEVVNKVVTINRGVDINSFQAELTQEDKQAIAQLKKEWKLVESKFTIIVPGRLTKIKGIDVIIHALSKIDAEYQCIIVGKYKDHLQYKENLDNLIIKYKLTANIKIFPAIKKIKFAYIIADLIIANSIKPEAFGRIPIEAGILGKIVIASNHGGFKSTIVNNNTGFLIEPHNVEELSLKIKEMMKLTKEEYEVIGQNATNLVKENFDIKKMLSKIMNLYKDLLS